MAIEQRQSARKVLHVKAVLAMDGLAPLTARSVDIGGNGMCLVASAPLKVGSRGQIDFAVYIDGVVRPVSARAQVSYCIISRDEFKIGFQFLHIGISGMSTLARFLG